MKSAKIAAATAEAMKRYKIRPKSLRSKLPTIPSAANWGWSHLPAAAKVLIMGVLCGIVSLTTPYWAYIRTEYSGTSTFGLWHYCMSDSNKCTSIHDNLMPNRSVPSTCYY